MFPSIGKWYAASCNENANGMWEVEETTLTDEGVVTLYIHSTPEMTTPVLLSTMHITCLTFTTLKKNQILSAICGFTVLRQHFNVKHIALS